MKKIVIEEFDIKGDAEKGIESLKEFSKEKNLGKNNPAVIGCYITKRLNKDGFSEGNVEFAVKALKLGKRPTNLHQAI